MTASEKHGKIGVRLALCLTFHLDFAKFFFSCSETDAWMLRSALAPVILRKKKGE